MIYSFQSRHCLLKGKFWNLSQRALSYFLVEGRCVFEPCDGQRQKGNLMPLPRSLPRSLGSPQIYFWEVQRRNLTERVKTLFLAENSVKLKNLTGYTAYMVSVAAFNAAGDGPRSTPTRGQTQQAGREKS